MSHVNGNVCLVTGASRALGAEIARRLGRAGAKVVVNYHHSAAEAEALCAELNRSERRAIAVQADVTDAEQVDRLVGAARSAFGSIDLLVNNVGPYVDTPFLDMPLADNEGMQPDFVDRSVASTPLGRLVTRAEVAEMVYQLCGPAFSVVTGHTLVMDGGRHIPRIAMG